MAALDYIKTPSNKNLTIWIGPTASGALGVTDVDTPLAAELNNTGGTSGMIDATSALSWSDTSVGFEASDTNNAPSMADDANYTTRGLTNYGGAISAWMPRVQGDTSNPASNLFDLLKEPGTLLDVAMRIDGAAGTGAAVDGDLVSVMRVRTGGWANPFTPGEDKRYTVTLLPEGEFSFLRAVGAQTITIIPATGGMTVGTKTRIRASIQGRDRTAALKWSSSNPAVIESHGNGVVSALSAGTATITALDEGTGLTATRSITVS